MKHVTSHIHLIFMYWMKHVISQLSECSCAVWYHLQSDIICSLILLADLIWSAVWYHSQFDIMSDLILSILIYSIFLSYFNFISLQSYCSFIQFFHVLAAFYCHQEQQHFSKETFVMNTALSQHLVSLDYSLCTSQIYISVHSFIALRKFIFFTLIFIMLTCCYRVSESSYVYSTYWKAYRDFSSLFS